METTVMGLYGDFQKNRWYPFGGPYNKGYSIWGPILGFP